MDSLVAKLSEGSHPVALSRVDSVEDLQECLDRNFVLVKFTGTQGGTELGVPLDQDRSSTGSADFSNSSGEIDLVGDITLNFVPVEVSAKIDIATLQGTGSLRVLD